MDLEKIAINSTELRQFIESMPIWVKKRAVVRKVPPNYTLLYKGDSIDYIYVLCDGKVKIINIFREGSIFVVGKGDNAEFIGEQGVIAGEQNAAVTVVTMTECQLICISREDFMYWIDQDHQFTKYLLKKLAVRLYPISRDKGLRSYYNSRYLLERYLVENYERRGLEVLTIMVTRQKMAEEIGISLRSLERGISNLKKDDYLTVVKRKITVSKTQFIRLCERIED